MNLPASLFCGVLFASAALGAPAAAPPPATYTEQVMEGWTLHVNERLQREEPVLLEKALGLIRGQLAQINRLLSPEALARLHTVPLWINPPYPNVRPWRAEYHPGAGWLRDQGRDPAMAKGIEITNTAIFERECRRMPMLLLHELAHAYHDQVLGFDHPEILAAYEEAKRSGRYDEVQRWTGEKTVKAEAYARTNPREYFAETTEAYFGRNDFQPFDRAELERMDPAMAALLARLWKAK